MKRLIFPALLLLASTASAKVTTYDWSATVKEPTTSFDWSGQDTQPTWKVAIGDLIKGTLKIDDQAEREDLEDGSGVYHQAAYMDLTVGGEHFTNSSNEWFVNSQFQGVGTYLMVNDRNDLTLDLDWNFPKQNPLDLTLAEATDITNQAGYFGIDGWQGSIETNQSGVIDSITKRLELVDAAPTPEPSSFVLMGSGLLAFALFRRRRLSRTRLS